jgi:alcohol dehydrogenase class IV
MMAINAPQLVRIGEHAAMQLPEVLGLLGARRPIVVVDRHFEGAAVIAKITAALEAAAIEPELFYGVVPDPTTASVREACAAAKAHKADAVVAIGGGSAIDTGKAVALLSVHDVELRAWRAPHRVTETGRKLVAIPTTAGTGSEATRFCLVSDSETGDKMVCIGEGFMPTAALIDFSLTLTVPLRTTADTGIDAFTHALEALVGHKANAMSNLYAEKALVLIAKALPALMEDLADRDARADMMLGSYLAGTAFSNSGLALAHGMSAPLGASFHIPHGLSIGLLLAEVTRFSIARAPAPYAGVARLLDISDSRDERVASAAFMSWLDTLIAKLSLPKLSQLGIEHAVFVAAIDAMATETPRSGAAANNPAVAAHDDIKALFHKVWA